MAKKSFPYLIFDKLDEEGKVVGRVMRPYIPLRLSVNHGNPTNIVNALVDSGSDRNLFPKSWGDVLGVNFKKITPIRINGIGSSSIVAYPAKVSLWIGSEKYGTDADFSPDQQTPLLGRQGFLIYLKKLYLMKI